MTVLQVVVELLQVILDPGREEIVLDLGQRRLHQIVDVALDQAARARESADDIHCDVLSLDPQRLHDAPQGDVLILDTQANRLGYLLKYAVRLAGGNANLVRVGRADRLADDCLLSWG